MWVPGERGDGSRGGGATLRPGGLRSGEPWVGAGGMGSGGGCRLPVDTALVDGVVNGVPHPNPRGALLCCRQGRDPGAEVGCTHGRPSRRRWSPHEAPAVVG